jgi:hypothetical protein
MTKRAWKVALALAAAVFGCAPGCAKKKAEITPPTAAELRAEVGNNADHLDWYLGGHSFAKTKPKALAFQAQMTAEHFRNLAGQADTLAVGKDKAAYAAVAAEARRGEKAATALAATFAAGPPAGDAAKAAALRAAVAAWARFTVTTTPGAAAPDLPGGRGRHGAWWRARPWAAEPYAPAPKR